jgi:hypothetical protein
MRVVCFVVMVEHVICYAILDLAGNFMGMRHKLHHVNRRRQNCLLAKKDRQKKQEKQ